MDTSTGNAVLLGSSNPLCAETVAAGPAARIHGPAARGSSPILHCKKACLESSARLYRGMLLVCSAPAFYPLIREKVVQ